MVSTRRNPSSEEPETPNLRDVIGSHVTEALHQILSGLFAQMKDEILEAVDQRIDTAFTTCGSTSGSSSQAPGRTVTFKDFMAGCPAEMKVFYAVNLLRNAGKDWWGMILKSRTEEQINAMTWDEFKVLLDEQFAPRIEKQRITSEFLNLAQTTETVNEITDQFLEKSLFCPDYVSTEEMKIFRYRGVLKAEIREFVATSICKSFDAMVEPGHIKPNCPQLVGATAAATPASTPLMITNGSTGKKSGSTTGGRGRVFQLTAEEADPDVRSCVHVLFPVNTKSALVLFDTGATWSFVSNAFCKDLRLERGRLARPLAIDIAAGEVRVCEDVYRGCSLVIHGVPFTIGSIPTPARALDDIQGDERLNYIVRPVLVLERKVRKLVIKKIMIVKVQGQYRMGPSGPGSQKRRCGSVTQNFSRFDFKDKILISERETDGNQEIVGEGRKFAGKVTRGLARSSGASSGKDKGKAPA
ncbi:hypothetical protein OSB04_032007 [Centaurea solstitialis]|uniref:Retrotransposon gag domain-containing protein n=1 Tax=Centaurea solstitialis TaxID=347529 RepID=A0AA38SBV4_9ASTR|nr:hypothetical protein OSB04_032007 [Centaurea solstitialis]